MINNAHLRQPLTPAQIDIWLDQSVHPQTTQFNISPYYLIPLALDADRFIAAANWVFSNYDALYARLVPGAADVPELLFDPAHAPRCEFLDLTGKTDPEGTLQALLADRARTPFGMLDRGLTRPVLIKTGERAYCYACEHFHLVMDAWGSAIVFQRIAQAYEALGAGREPQREGPGYADFMKECRAPADETALARALEFWRSLLAAPMPQLPPTHTLGADQDERTTACVRATLPRALADRVVQQVASCNATLFHAVVLAFNHALAKQYGRESPPVSLPILNRSKLHKETIGFFIEERTLPMPLDENATVAENLQAIARRVRELFRHYRVPASTLAHLNQAHGHTGAPGGASAISYITRDFGASIDGLAIPMTDRPPTHGTTPFTLYFLDIYPGQDLTIELIYRRSHADRDEAELLLQRFIHVLDGIARDPQRPLADLDVVPPEERRRIAAALHRAAEYVAAPRLVIDDILARAHRYPDAIAIEAGDTRRTYREGVEQAHAIAHALAERHDVRPGDRVALLLPRSAELVASQLGVMLAGATFVPIDPYGPDFRARQIGEDSAVKCLLTISALAGKARAIQAGAIEVDTLAGSGKPFPSRATPEQIAYILYTSGSTGRPKGVEIPHRALADHCASWLQAVPLREGAERVLFFSSPAFDASIETAYPALIQGNTLVMAPHPQWMPHELAGVIMERHLTVLNLPPEYLLELLKQLREIPGRIAGHEVRLGLAGGNVMHAATAPLWDAVFGASATLFNLYGPTEITVSATAFALPSGYRAEPGESIPIGRPHRGRALRIVDERGRTAPLGADGELLIGGLGLARGYHGMPEETAAHFVTLEDGGHYYRSGDIVRLRTDGQIVFRRRGDSQVKVRGFRVEPGEIEACLHTHPAVGECVVVVRPGEDGPSGGLRAFATLLPGASGDATALRDHLLARLPDYMVPAIALLDRLPKTASGKIDRKALQDLTVTTEPPRVEDPVLQPPQGPVQEFLALLWAQTLGSAVADVRADFFAQGGHSLLAARLIANIGRAFRVEFPFSAFFARPTLADTARELERLVGNKTRLEKMATVRLELAHLRPEEIQARLARARLRGAGDPART